MTAARTLILDVLIARVLMENRGQAAAAAPKIRFVQIARYVQQTNTARAAAAVPMILSAQTVAAALSSALVTLENIGVTLLKIS